MKHTPGPWKVNFAQHRGDFSIDNERGDIEIARTGNREAARLIAAAPELLKAALSLLDASASMAAHYRPGVGSAIGKPIYDAMDQTRAVITKAEGKV